MTNDRFKVLKLKTGETILCTLDRDLKHVANEAFLYLNEPVQVVPYQETRKNGQILGESFILRPWVGLSDSDEFVISTDIVLTIGKLKKEVREQYVSYISQAQETKRRIQDREERSEAADQLLRELSNGELHIIQEDDYYNDENEEE
jgi:hypothetical protein